MSDPRSNVAGQRARVTLRRACCAAVTVLALAAGCASAPATGPAGAAPSAPAEPPTSGGSPSPNTAQSAPASPTEDSAPSADTATSTPAPRTTTSPRPRSRPPGLVGERRNAFAFAPLADPSDVTVEGRVSRSPAWSTSKVLVVAAFLDAAADGDPDRLSTANRSLVDAALTRSDADAVLRLRQQIPGRPGPAMTAVLRRIGDSTTVAPDDSQGLMPWSVREQVRFMAALANGQVVSRAASAYLMASMQPIPSHAWGLGTIDATSFKGGWLRGDTVTRQMGVVDGYAVALITDGVGPAVRQSDGDFAHVRQMNKLAQLLKARLTHERARR